MPVAAPLIIGIGTVGASAIAAGAQKSAANKAAAAQTAANDKNIAQQQAPQRIEFVQGAEPTIVLPMPSGIDVQRELKKLRY